MKLATYLLFLLTPLFLFAQAVPPETIDEATALLPSLLAKLVGGEYLMAGGVLIMILMVGVRQYLLPKWKLSNETLPWVTALISMVSMVGLSLFNNVPILEAIKNGFVIAIISGGTWDMLGKSLAKLVLGDKYQETLKK